MMLTIWIQIFSRGVSNHGVFSGLKTARHNYYKPHRLLKKNTMALVS